MDVRRRFLGNKLKTSPNVFNPDNYLTIEALEDGLYASLSDNDCEYCINDSNVWITLPAGTNTQTINSGNTLLFRGRLSPTYSIGIGTFTVNKNFNLKGNCMSMLYYDYAGYASVLNLSYAFRSLFENCTTLKNVYSNFLPATSITSYVYEYMFRGCTSLITPPSLPATTLGSSCYYAMFYNCTSLEEPPSLPATTLAYKCYNRMFYNCTSLTNAPSLPATTFALGCYGAMVGGTNLLPDCTNINFSDENTINSGVCHELFYDTIITDSDLMRLLPTNSSGKYCLPVMNLTIDNVYDGMFYSCDKLTIAPELPATTLTNHCYDSMFAYCSSLITAPVLPATVLAPYCYYSMFQSCYNLITAPELPAKTLTTNCYYGMFMFCRQLNYIKMLATDIQASNCLTDWVYYVSSTGTFEKMTGVNIPTGRDGIPDGWTIVNIS